MEHRETPGAATEATRRFARFVAAPRVRRLVLTRIGLAGLAALLMLAALMVLLELATSWLNGHPDYQLPFRKITLVPPPPAWYRGGAAVFLDRVRDGDPSKETLSVLSVDLAELGNIFRLYCWVDKVGRVERSYPNRLVVHLEYRKPVALVQSKYAPDRVIDKDGVILPMEDINWGAAGRLIWISGLEPPFDPRPGRVWKSGDSVSGQAQGDERVLAAAKLADFLKTVLEREKPRLPDLPPHVAIPFESNDQHTLFVQIGPSTMFLWREAPGAEHPGQLTAEAKWAMLRDWVRANPKLRVRWPSYLTFTRSGVVIFHAEGGS
jgi:hypothetical protein